MTAMPTGYMPSTARCVLILALVCVAMLGNNYVYDSIGPVADMLQRQRGYLDTQIGMLNAIYSLPNIVLVLIGGVLVDRFGAARVTLITTVICLAGAVLTALSPSFFGMACGRLLFGIGAETFQLATIAAVADYFEAGHLALAMGVSLSLGRLGSYAADMSPSWFPASYAQGWQPPLLIAAAISFGSLCAAALYWWCDGPLRRAGQAGRVSQRERFAVADLLHFGPAYWYLLLLCVFWYAVIFAFRSTFAIKYFQHVHNLDLATAGAMNSYVFFAAIFATPLFGWICDRTRRYAPLLAFGALLLPIALALMALTPWSLWIATALIGVSYSLVPAVMWPLTRRIIPRKRYGTGLGLMWIVQNAGIAGANLVAGALNNAAGASAAHPAGYQDMMLFFGVSAGLGAIFALLLWSKAGSAAAEV